MPELVVGAREQLTDLGVDRLVFALEPQIEEDLGVFQPALLDLVFLNGPLDPGPIAL